MQPAAMLSWAAPAERSSWHRRLGLPEPLYGTTMERSPDLLEMSDTRVEAVEQLRTAGRMNPGQITRSTPVDDPSIHRLQVWIGRVRHRGETGIDFSDVTATLGQAVKHKVQDRLVEDPPAPQREVKIQFSSMVVMMSSMVSVFRLVTNAPDDIRRMSGNRERARSILSAA